MIRRSFFQVLSGLLLPHPVPEAAGSPEPGPRRMMLPPAVPGPDPEWLRQWRKIPRLEIRPEDLPLHHNPYQLELAAEILSRIHAGTHFTFRYLGGSVPGEIRHVLPTSLFRLDYFNDCMDVADDPTELPEPAGCPLYLLAWCLSRNAPRTFRLDRMQEAPRPLIPHSTIGSPLTKRIPLFNPRNIAHERIFLSSNANSLVLRVRSSPRLKLPT